MKMKNYIKLFILLFLLAVVGLQVESDDKELFMGLNIGTDVVRPNVVILMDSSGSMNTIIYYPKEFGPDGIENTDDDDVGFDPTITYSGTVEGFTSATTYLGASQYYARWVYSGNAYQHETSDLEGWDGKNFWTGCYEGDGSGTNFRAGSNGANYFRTGEKIIYRDKQAPFNPAVATIKQKYTDADGATWFELEDIVGGPITPDASSSVCHFQQSPDGQNWKPEIVNFYGTYDVGQSTRWPREYVKWIFIHATDAQRDAVTHFSTWATFDVDNEPIPELSECATPGNNDLEAPGPRIKTLFTRMQVAREVVCKVATDSNAIVNLGLFKFNSDEGGTLQEGLTDMSDESSALVAYKNNVWGIAGDSWTPLAEALADVWYYYKPGPASKTYWPVDYEISANLVNHSVTNPVTPIQYWCQNNYAVLMTDGESTQDRFNYNYSNSIFRNKPVRRTGVWESWDDGWGDTDYNETNGGVPSNYDRYGTYCPNYTCWYYDSGSDYLDDVAYFLRHQDMFPDEVDGVEVFGSDPVTGWPGEQNIFTYTIGFNTDSDMLLQTAINGDGAYYTANSYEELVEAFTLIITSINLRNYAFSSITAPKKSTTTTNEELTMSYVGYFMPSQAAAIWEGHLLAFELQDLWGYDEDSSDTVEEHEFIYDTERDCVTASDGVPCERWIYLNIGHEWDAADKIPADRNLFTNDADDVNTLLEFNDTNTTPIQAMIGNGVTADQTQQIIAKINQPHLGDIYHSDVTFIGSPPPGKQYLPNIEPPGENDQQYVDFYNNNKYREKVIYTGTNDGIMHMFYSGGSYSGQEIWGFLPDSILPTLKDIVLNTEHNYTVDGRITAEDIYFQKGGSVNVWATIMVFGLRRGGEHYYALDITDVEEQPSVLWKFKDDDWSGQTFGKAVIGRVLIEDEDDPGTDIVKWVVFLPGGFALNSENPNDKKGKSIFVLDAATGELLWMLGYDPDAEPVGGAEPGNLSTGPSADNKRLLTKDERFNYSIPSAMTVVDSDNNGYVDTVYFGNVGGFLFKTDTSGNDPMEWSTTTLFETEITDVASATIAGIVDSEITVDNKTFEVGFSIMGKTSYATGFVRAIDNKTLTVNTTSGTFLEDETIVCRSYDPIYLPPAILYDRCSQLWVSFGTGDRDRPRSNPFNGNFVIFKDNGTVLQKIGPDSINLIDVSNFWLDDQMAEQQLNDMNGFWFAFPDDGEKLFDPSILVLPDNNFNPHIYFNTYQPPPAGTTVLDNPCDAPDEGAMTIFHMAIECGDNIAIEGGSQKGRIAGGGVYGGKEYVMYEGTDGNVASAPGSDEGESNLEAKITSLDYSGGVVFWIERRR